jgi:hypothetical protein
VVAHPAFEIARGVGEHVTVLASRHAKRKPRRTVGRRIT